MGQADRCRIIAARSAPDLCGTGYPRRRAWPGVTDCWPVELVGDGRAVYWIDHAQGFRGILSSAVGDGMTPEQVVAGSTPVAHPTSMQLVKCGL